MMTTTDDDRSADAARSHAPYRDASRPVGERVLDLLARMTLEEKAAQITTPFSPVVDTTTAPPLGWGSAVAAISSTRQMPREAAARANELQRKHVEETRLGIPLLFAEEALLGLKVRDATTFPDAIAQAATWEPELIEEMAQGIGKQMVALGVRMALSPLADVARDPRWGRVGETYGEDPYLVGTIASAFVRGLQGADRNKPLVAALKHFLAYGASDGGRNTETVNLGPRALRETYGRPFEMAIRTAGARGIMPSYSEIDGAPVTGSRELLTDLLKDEYGFTGIVISDLNAVPQLHTKHRSTEELLGAYAQAIRAGLDLDLDIRVSVERITEAVTRGLLREAELDRAVATVLRTKFELGLFENPYVDVDAVPETFDTPATRDLARTIAEKSIVLLQNRPVGDTPLLPLTRGAQQKIAVIGPNADRPLGQLGHYSYHVLDSMTERFEQAANPQARAADAEDLAGSGPDDVLLMVDTVPVVTFLDGIRNYVGNDSTITYAEGSRIAALDRSGFEEATRIASEADIAIMVVGDQAGINSLGSVGEGLDGTDLELPGVQRQLVEAVVATGTPTVVVLSHARPFVLGWMADKVPAILTAWFGGEEAGAALARVLFGDVDPGGRLPIAMLQSAGAAPVTYARNLEGPAYVDGSVHALFPFGHGTSYTRFQYAGLAVESDQVPTSGSIRIAFTVRNVGARAGTEVVQIYGQDVHGRTVRPVRTLVGFLRVNLAAGDEQCVVAEIPASMFALWDPREGWVVEPGLVRLFVGASSTDERLHSEVRLTGPVHEAGRHRRLTSSVRSTRDIAFSFENAVAAEPSTSVAPPLTADSTVSEWLAHPTGGPLLREALGGVDDATLSGAFGLTLEQMVGFSQGALPDTLPEELLARATGSDR